MKLNKKQRDGLQWIAERQPIAWFDRTAPSPTIRKKLYNYGLIQRVEAVDIAGSGSPFKMVCYGLTEEGRKALEGQL